MLFQPFQHANVSQAQCSSAFNAIPTFGRGEVRLLLGVKVQGTACKRHCAQPEPMRERHACYVVTP
jgi:hypothetical protein